MEFMGISVGILALVAALVLLFGTKGTRKILGWSCALLVAIGLSAVIVSLWPQTKPENRRSSSATPVEIFPPLPAGFELDNTSALSDKIKVKGPDKRIFVFASGTSEAAITSYMQSQFGAPGSSRGECWTKEPGPWCSYR